MPHGSVSEIIPAASSQVFDLLHDYERRLAWDTLLSAAYLTDGASQAALGATSVCVGRRALGGIAFKTVYVAFDRPRLAAVKMVNRPPFFSTWAATIRHEDLGPGESRLTYTWTFTARPRVLAWLLEPIMQRAFTWETRKRLRALRSYLRLDPNCVVPAR
ncbi:MAG: SRPBCC family protein [Pirellulaceae bacterium]